MKTFLPPRRLRRIALLTLILLSSLPTLAVDFTYTYKGQTITYTVIDEAAKTCKTKEGKSKGYYGSPGNNVQGDLVLPENPNGYKLVGIGDYAFCDCSDLTSIEIPNSVTYIGHEAFQRCYGLSFVYIPNSVTNMGQKVFLECSSRATISIAKVSYRRDIHFSHTWDLFDGEKVYRDMKYNNPKIRIGLTDVTVIMTDNPYYDSEMTPARIVADISYYYGGQIVTSIPLIETQTIIDNLDWYTSYGISLYAVSEGLDGRVGLGYENISLGWGCNVSNTQQAPTTAVLNAKFTEEDVKPDKVWWEFDGQKVDGTSVTLVSLKPDSSYSADFCISYNGKTYRKSASFSTSKLELETLTPKCVSSSCAIVAAKTNISDWEPMAGFEWKKYDAPASMAPNKGYGAVCEGVLEGYIKNLQSTSYYNVRPFYQDAQGNFYYGEWVTFDPSDFSYFEPTVHTYPVQEVTTSTAKVRGYALSGTDNIISQGFQYWSSGAASARYFAPSASEITTVPASGQVMTATFENLKENTTYVYRAYVETEAGFTYGEEMTFTTESTSGIGENWYEDAENEAPTIVGYYDLQGRRYNTPQPGLNIVLYSDGTTRKIMAKR